MAEGERFKLSEEKARQLKKEETERTESIVAIDVEREKLQKETGRLQADIDSFNREEDTYQKAYGTIFVRNVLGKYEDGALILESERLSDEMKGIENTRKAERERRQKAEVRAKKIESDLGEQRIKRNDLLHRKENLNFELSELERQKRERLEACVFAGLDEEALFDREGILHAFGLKIGVAEENILKTQEKENKIRREKEALESGKIAEIPERIAEGFGKLGISLTFGMEWLMKNGRSADNNLELVRKNPFLPYSIILTDKELDRIVKNDESCYTEMPLPVILRQELEKGIVDPQKESCPVLEMENIRFYVRFNENLLYPDRLQEMVAECRLKIKGLRDKIEILRAEKEEFIRWREIVRTESLTRESMEKAILDLRAIEEEIGENGKRIAELETEKEENAQTIEEARKIIEETEKKSIALTEQIRRLDELARKYELYLSSLEKKYFSEKELKRLLERKKLILDMIEKLREKMDICRREAETAKSLKEQADKKLQVFSLYAVADKETATPSDEERIALEAEYEAITEKFSGSIKQLEKSFSEQEKRYRKVETELERLRKKYGISNDELQGAVYSDGEYERLQESAADIGGKIAIKEEQYHREDKEISIKDAQIGERIRRMTEETGEAEPLPAEEIPDIDFNEELAVLKHERKVFEKEKSELEKRQQAYRELIDSLDEFAGLPQEKEIFFEEDFSLMDEEALREFRGIMRRDLKRFFDERQKRRNRLSDALNDLIMRPVFRDDFYRKPLEAMQRTVDSPGEVLRQIEITLQSYDDLMEKIGVDLSVIEDERKSIQDQLLDYIRDVNSELDKIDSNSAIPVRDRTIKMLTVSIPSYSENEEIYRIRVRDYLEVIVKHCMGLCRQNQNMDEYIGTKVNIRELFDSVVGVGNVQIRLYKIERQREYPISWAEVSKNSGGEGFLSSFVILSSLLHYMRRDENDLFADRNEGKVLLMDNPFGITYSEHLLKPLMELAAKNNTQLICFSGIGGDSIYGRFDNIYVLNLIAAGLKSGVQYLRSEHIRGSEQEVISASHLEVIEQMSLF